MPLIDTKKAWKTAQRIYSDPVLLYAIKNVLDSTDTVDAVVIPCKPGDTVFVLWRLADPDICSKCPDFHWGGMGDSHECGKTEDGFRSAECIEIQEWTANRDRILSWIGFDEFGKTVFLTREEAEAALAEMKGGAGNA